MHKPESIREKEEHRILLDIIRSLIYSQKTWDSVKNFSFNGFFHSSEP